MGAPNRNRSVRGWDAFEVENGFVYQPKRGKGRPTSIEVPSMGFDVSALQEVLVGGARFVRDGSREREGGRA